MSDASRLADLFDSAERIVVFTGAGISTESGIPDFRSPGGIWSKMSPIYFQDFVASRKARQEGWNRVFNRTAGWTGAAPNAGHDAVAMSNITDVGMIFVRCKGGISHSPLEHITPEDAQAGADLLLRTVERIGGMTN